jgi:hypothetical protein
LNDRRVILSGIPIIILLECLSIDPSHEAY